MTNITIPFRFLTLVFSLALLAGCNLGGDPVDPRPTFDIASVSQLSSFDSPIGTHSTEINAASSLDGGELNSILLSKDICVVRLGEDDCESARQELEFSFVRTGDVISGVAELINAAYTKTETIEIQGSKLVSVIESGMDRDFEFKFRYENGRLINVEYLRVGVANFIESYDFTYSGDNVSSITYLRVGSAAQEIQPVYESTANPLYNNAIWFSTFVVGQTLLRPEDFIRLASPNNVQAFTRVYSQNGNEIARSTVRFSNSFDDQGRLIHSEANDSGAVEEVSFSYQD